MRSVDNAPSSELNVLESRIRTLEVLVCELLTKNERLRLANSRLAQDGTAFDCYPYWV